MKENNAKKIKKKFLVTLEERYRYYTKECSQEELFTYVQKDHLKNDHSRKQANRWICEAGYAKRNGKCV